MPGSPSSSRSESRSNLHNQRLPEGSNVAESGYRSTTFDATNNEHSGQETTKHSGNNSNSRFHDNDRGYKTERAHSNSTIAGNKNTSRGDHGSSTSPAEPQHNNWLFTENDLLKNTPSILSGMTPQEELVFRVKGVIFIQRVGRLVKLSQPVLYTAAMFYHRFFMRNSFKEVVHFDAGAASLFLASKVRESHRKIKELAGNCIRASQKNDHMHVDENHKDFSEWIKIIVYWEEKILTANCFDLNYECPFEQTGSWLFKLHLKSNPEVCRVAWDYLSESSKTTVLLLFPTKVICGSSIYYALKHVGAYRLANTVCGAMKLDEQEVRNCCITMMDVLSDKNFARDVTRRMQFVPLQELDQRELQSSAAAGDGESGGDSNAYSNSGSEQVDMSSGSVEKRKQGDIANGSESEDDAVRDKIPRVEQ